ncbi:MAG: ribonuclease R [Gammaproteobacteria bacterium]
MAKRRKKQGGGAKQDRRGDKSYSHPVPGRRQILEALEEKGRPMKFEEISKSYGLTEKKHRRALGERLKRMIAGGQLILNRNEEYCLTERLHLVPGVVQAHPDGFGFLIPDEGAEDIYLSPREMQEVMHGDRIAVKVIRRDHRGRPEGKVIEVLEHRTREVAGQYVRERGIGIVVPDNPRIQHRILIARGESGKAKHGDMVIAELIDFPSRQEQATGRVARVLGPPGQHGMATDLAIHAHGIPHRWPRAVDEEAEAFGKYVPRAAKQGRQDLRDLPLVTIDGEDARDFDDAVYAEPVEDGWRVLVAIADVGHYVERGSAIDKEATKRGTSVYFPDRVVPMLPTVLSNGLCSLNPKVDRLCVVCEMTVGPGGKVRRSRFYEGVMRSVARLTYTQVAALIEGGKPGEAGIREELVNHIRNLHGAYRAFAKARARRGALELDIPAVKIELDEAGEIEAIRAFERNDAHRLIEECMIAANVEAAKFLRRKKVPTLYRVHAKPDPEKFQEFREYLLGLGLKVPHPEHVQAKDFGKLMQEVQDRPDSQAISMALLRSMAHAEYTPENIGHFGLALEAYAHFTSPIRRYPDLLVHRAIKHLVNGGKPKAFPYERGDMERLGQLTSAHERRAEDATREVEAWLKCQFMEDKIGEVHDGVVTGVTHFGLFVQIPEYQIDGLVHVSSLGNDYYEFEAGAQRLVGSRTGREYGLGDEVTVSVHRVDLDTRRIDFRLVDQTGG